MAISTTIKNFRDGSLTLSDATAGTPLSVTIQFESGDFAASSFNESNTEVTTYLDRGELASVRKTSRTFPTVSWTCHMSDLSDSTTKLVWDAVNKTGAFAAGVSTLGTASDVWTLKAVLTIEGSNFGDSGGDHVLTMNDVHLSVDFSEGDPNSFAFSGTMYGTYTAT